MRLEPQNSDLAFKTETVSDREVFFCERMSLCTVNVALARSARKIFACSRSWFECYVGLRASYKPYALRQKRIHEGLRIFSELCLLASVAFIAGSHQKVDYFAIHLTGSCEFMSKAAGNLPPGAHHTEFACGLALLLRLSFLSAHQVNSRKKILAGTLAAAL